MTARFQEAIKLAESLPPEEQDRIADLVLDRISRDMAVSTTPDFAAARERALSYLGTGFRLGGKALSREEAHQR